MMYRVRARVMNTKINAKGFTAYDVPTFYLNSADQRIVDRDHAGKIAKAVCNPTNDPELTVHVYICSMWSDEA